MNKGDNIGSSNVLNCVVGSRVSLRLCGVQSSSDILQCHVQVNTDYFQNAIKLFTSPVCLVFFKLIFFVLNQRVACHVLVSCQATHSLSHTAKGPILVLTSTPLSEIKI